MIMNHFFVNPRYGVRDVFDPEDLTEGRNIPKVTKCVDELAKLASKDPGSLLAAKGELSA
jgi:hypothetical protein